MRLFKDRAEAGKRLAQKLSSYKGIENGIIIAIPRGGLVIGAALSDELRLPLDVFFTKKIGHPNNPEYAAGVVGLEAEKIEEPLPTEFREKEVARIRAALQEKEATYRKGLPLLKLTGKTIIITDDGVATGKTLLLTIHLIQKAKPKKVVVAIPVGPKGALELFKTIADEVIFLETPQNFFAISEFYDNFDQVEDSEAIKLLKDHTWKSR